MRTFALMKLQEPRRDWGQARPAQRMAKRFREHGQAYVRFINTSGIEATNNLREQAIRSW